MFPDKEELLRNMMGLLGNVAEVQGLRQRLMAPEYITTFNKLLFSCSDGIEVTLVVTYSGYLFQSVYYIFLANFIQINLYVCQKTNHAQFKYGIGVEGL